MTHQIKTPILNTSARALLNVLTGVQSKTMDLAEASILTSAAGKIPHHVTADLKVRLAAPRLLEIEAVEEVAQKPALAAVA